MIKKVLPCLLSVAIFGLSSMGSQAQNDLAAAIKNYMEGPAASEFSGSLLVVDQGKPIFLKSFGVADRSTKRPNSPGTLFTLGSITKMFTAVAILQLEEKGLLRTTDLLSKYFDKVPADKNTITLHHLLTHGAGFPGAIGDDYAEINSGEFMKLAFSEKLLFPPGSGYEYSNVGFSILGIIIEKLTGMLYDQYMQQNIFRPSGMHCTGYTTDCQDEAVGYFKNGEEWGTMRTKKWDSTEPYWHLKANGGILSTAEDMAKWYTAFLSDLVLKETSRQKMLKGYNDENAGGSFYGYGIAEFSPNEHYGHNGGNGIFFADWHVFPQAQQALFICTHVAKTPVGKITQGLIQILQTGEAPIHVKTRPVKVDEFPTDLQDRIAQDFLRVTLEGTETNQADFLDQYFSPGVKERNGEEKLLKLFTNIKPEFEGREISAIEKGQNQLSLELTQKGNPKTILLIITYLNDQIDRLAIEASMDE